jgi:hypothetical protein
MALDTKEKRANAARVGRPWMRAKYARGATNESSRIASGHGYGGNALSAGDFQAAWAKWCNIIISPGTIGDD